MLVSVCVVCQSQCQSVSVIMYWTFMSASVCVFVCDMAVRLIECLRGCIVRRVEPVLFRELCHA